jgi:hypothetical protein
MLSIQDEEGICLMIQMFPGSFQIEPAFSASISASKCSSNIQILVQSCSYYFRTEAHKGSQGRALVMRHGDG